MDILQRYDLPALHWRVLSAAVVIAQGFPRQESMTPELPEQRGLPSTVFPGRGGLGACRSLLLGRTWDSPAWWGGTEPRAQGPFSLCISNRVWTCPGEGYPQRPSVCVPWKSGGGPSTLQRDPPVLTDAGSVETFCLHGSPCHGPKGESAGQRGCLAGIEGPCCNLNLSFLTLSTKRGLLGEHGGLGAPGRWAAP